MLEAEELGLHVERFHSMCGIPFCMGPEFTKSYVTLKHVDETLSGSDFVKPDPCNVCTLHSKCFCIRRGV